MKTNGIVALALLASLATFNAQLSTTLAQGTAFTYQGRLNNAGTPANGSYDLRFSVWNAESGPSLASGTFGTNALAVSNGLFTVTLDFGPGIFAGADRWLEIHVRTNGSGPFDTLSPRQKITATPYAVTAGHLASGGLAAGTYGSALNFSNSANSFSGSFGGNGGGLTNVNAATLGGIGSNGFWRSTGNAGTTPGPNFLGTMDNQPLELQVNSTRALRLEPHATSAPSLVGGYFQNSVAGFHGATVAGGGTSGSPNYALGNYAFVGAGHGGQAADYSAVVAGAYNVSPGLFSFIGSGQASTNAANYSFIGGGSNNLVAALADSSFIGGGRGNSIQPYAYDSVLGGGQGNSIQTGATLSVLGGGYRNSIQLDAFGSFLGGGGDNSIQQYGVYTVLGGGWSNSIQPFATYSFLGGGFNNSIQAYASLSVLGGGTANTIQPDADFSVLGGGQGNSVLINGQYATIPGGRDNTAANYAFAAGRRAKAIHTGAFVWADSANADFASTASDQFLIRAGGGVGINKTNPTTALDVNGSVTATAFRGNGGSLTNLDASQLSSGTVPAAMLSHAWQRAGNSGTTPGTDFIGTTDNQALAVKVNNVTALQFVPGTTLPNLVGGMGGFRSSFLASGVSGAVIVGGNAPSGGVHGQGGGDFHAVYDNDGTVGGGFGNKAGSNNGDITDGAFATVAGGVFNSAANYAATVCGGDGNFAGGQRSFIGGGYANQARANFSAAAGGLLNSISDNADYAVIGGGDNNSIQTNAHHSVLGGGQNNSIQTNATHSFLGGGDGNSIQMNAAYSVLGGGYLNDIGTDSAYSAIGGGRDNNIAANSAYGTIAGGYFNDISTDAHYSAIGGGLDNDIAANSFAGTIAGGYVNDIDTDSYYSAISGGYNNYIGANSSSATVAGGYANNIGTGSDYSAIGGGQHHYIAANSLYATIAGGRENEIGTNSDHTAIGGGFGNNIAANSFIATIAGGYLNNIGTNSGYSAIGGGFRNKIASDSPYATIPGGENNFATSYAFAAGRNAKATYTGSFIWADSNPYEFAANIANKVRFRCTSGFDIITGIDGFGNPTAGVYLGPGGTSWQTVSDRNAKRNVQAVDAAALLDKLAAVPVTQWNYRWEAAGAVPHIGPMAQDFKAAFYPGRDDKSISTLEFDGVALAAIQGLNEKLEERGRRSEVRSQRAEDRIRKLEAENAELKQRLEALERIIRPQSN